jgi:hypothetical protein
MRIKIRPGSLLSPALAGILFFGIAAPVFPSGDDKPAAPAKTNVSVTATAATNVAATTPAPKPDREKKVYTNDDIDRMWPRQKAIVIAVSPSAAPSVGTTREIVVSTPVSPEKDPVWYAEQIAELSAELEQLNNREQALRDFLARGTGQDPHAGLQLNAPCEGITTSNAIAQLSLRRQEIEQQFAALEDTAQQNGIRPGVLRDAPAILAAAQPKLTPAQERTALAERQAVLSSELAATQVELGDMSSQAASIGATLQPPTPGFGGNMTTDLIERLDNRASEIQRALDQTEEAAR